MEVPVSQVQEETVEVIQQSQFHRFSGRRFTLRTDASSSNSTCTEDRHPRAKLDTRTMFMPGTSQTRIGEERNRRWNPHSTLRTCMEKADLTNQHSKVQYFDKVADKSVDMQTQVSHHSGGTVHRRSCGCPRANAELLLQPSWTPTTCA